MVGKLGCIEGYFILDERGIIFLGNETLKPDMKRFGFFFLSVSIYFNVLQMSQC